MDKSNVDLILYRVIVMDFLNWWLSHWIISRMENLDRNEIFLFTSTVTKCCRKSWDPGLRSMSQGIEVYDPANVFANVDPKMRIVIKSLPYCWTTRRYRHPTIGSSEKWESQSHGKMLETVPVFWSVFRDWHTQKTWWCPEVGVWGYPFIAGWFLSGKIPSRTGW